MGLFFYTQKGSIISTVVLPTTEIIEPKKRNKVWRESKDSLFLFTKVLKKIGNSNLLVFII
ncbi:hypothetical protein NGA77_09665, partial [Streptococcus suis]|nr:hypothetical protein [Streptococcus suis]MCO0845272.1 hypothetical protein [Streptococcus suis]MDX5028573.1 hypothetical protein [Streptococcus suis]